MRNIHPLDFMDDDERREHRNAVMAMQAEMAKHLPRIVYDHKNDTVNVVTTKDGLSWKKKEEKEHV